MAVFFSTGCLHLDVGQGEGVVIHFGTKKTWNSTVVVPRIEAFALPLISEQQREAHVDISYNDDYIICAKSVPNQRRHNHGYLHPIGHLSLLGS